MSQDNKEFTLEDILAEERAKREVEAAQQAARKDLAQERQSRQPGARPPQRPAGQPAPRPAAPQSHQPTQPQQAQPQGQQPQAASLSLKGSSRQSPGKRPRQT